MPTWNAFYLGVGPVIDPTEGNTLAENASALVGATFGGIGNALSGNITSVTTNDLNGDDALNQNNNLSNESFTADIGAGTQTFTFDAAAAYNATVTYLDGSTATVVVVVFQDTLGNTFLAPGLTAAANTALIAGPILSVTLNSLNTGSALGLGVNRPVIPLVPCFVAGSLIRTSDGPRPVETLVAGDRVWTRDRGMQRLNWVGAREVAGDDIFAPIRFAPGAMGNRRALLVSPQHRMLVTGWRAELHFGEPEVLVAACHLVNGDTIHRLPMPRVRYHHVMFDRHEVIEAEGALTESFFAGDCILNADDDLRRELCALFPELAGGAGPGLTARPVPRGAEARVLAAPVN